MIAEVLQALPALNEEVGELHLHLLNDMFDEIEDENSGTFTFSA